jgi:hypothetical protein
MKTQAEIDEFVRLHGDQPLGTFARAVVEWCEGTTQPNRYREGFEKAREMAAENCDFIMKLQDQRGDARGVDMADGAFRCASSIRNMEMPDE